MDELLYALLLPSGNDASVAIGEQVGQQLDAPGGPAEESDPLVRFVAKMNRTAQSLGLDDTRYRNTHGMTEPDHLTSVRDLARLAAHAMQIPRFREIVGTAQHGCTVHSSAGYSRNVLWKNTNRLLRIEGYHGIKTGTTNAAGACLVSYGSRNDKSLIVVVLGSHSSDARYTDTRNLFSWGWRQLFPAEGTIECVMLGKGPGIGSCSSPTGSAARHTWVVHAQKATVVGSRDGLHDAAGLELLDGVPTLAQLGPEQLGD